MCNIVEETTDRETFCTSIAIEFVFSGFFRERNNYVVKFYESSAIKLNR